jgi:DNA-binding GntR family transcriptional regulator
VLTGQREITEYDDYESLGTMQDNDKIAALTAPEKPRLVDRAYEEIRRYIIQGVLPPRTRLVEQKLTKSLGISRTPLREALRRLEQDGLIERLPGGGLSVIELTVDDLNEIMGIRAVLEGHCAALAAVRISEQALAELFSAHDDAAEAIRRGDLAALAAANTRLHDGINAAANSPRSLAIVDDMREIVLRYRTEALSDESTRQHSFDQHIEILNAIKAGDAERSERLVRAHIGGVARYLTDARTRPLRPASPSIRTLDERPSTWPCPRPCPPRASSPGRLTACSWPPAIRTPSTWAGRHLRSCPATSERHMPAFRRAARTPMSTGCPRCAAPSPTSSPRRACPPRPGRFWSRTARCTPSTSASVPCSNPVMPC